MANEKNYVEQMLQKAGASGVLSEQELTVFENSLIFGDGKVVGFYGGDLQKKLSFNQLNAMLKAMGLRATIRMGDDGAEQETLKDYYAPYWGGDCASKWDSWCTPRSVPGTDAPAPKREQ